MSHPTPLIDQARRSTTSPRAARGFTLIELLMMVSILGVLASLATQNLQGGSCRARQTEAQSALRAIVALEASHRAERDVYVQVATSCPAASTTCLTLPTRGPSNYTVTADVTPAGFTATAIGRAGTQVADSVWRIDQSNALVDVSGTCKVNS